MSAAYDFTRSGAGGYSIKPSNLFTYVDTGGTLKNLYAAIEYVAEVKLSGNLAVSRRVHDKRDIKFDNCSSGEESVIRDAAFYADIYAIDAYEHLKYISRATPRYRYWFGPDSDARRSLVESHFERISYNKFESFHYICDNSICPPKHGAYARACIFQP